VAAVDLPELGAAEQAGAARRQAENTTFREREGSDWRVQLDEGREAQLEREKGLNCWRKRLDTVTCMHKREKAYEMGFDTLSRRVPSPLTLPTPLWSGTPQSRRESGSTPLSPASPPCGPVIAKSLVGDPLRRDVGGGGGRFGSARACLRCSRPHLTEQRRRVVELNERTRRGARSTWSSAMGVAHGQPRQAAHQDAVRVRSEGQSHASSCKAMTRSHPRQRRAAVTDTHSAGVARGVAGRSDTASLYSDRASRMPT
jgi:hypothetical protein